MPYNVNIQKTDPDKHLIFGWAYVSRDESGSLVRDLQGDSIDIAELESAAYQHVLQFHSAGEAHDPQRRAIGELIESVVLTPEKKQALNIEPAAPYGWWVGYHISDADAWQRIRSGEYQMLSIEGIAKRADATALTFLQVLDTIDAQLNEFITQKYGDSMCAH